MSILGYNTPNSNPKKVPQHSILEIVNPAKSLALANLYGVGIRAAVINLYKQEDNKTYANSGQGNSNTAELVRRIHRGNEEYLPDFHINSDGVYDKNAVWDGTMSHSLVGMPVMSAIKFKGGSYVDLQGNEVIVPSVELQTVILTVKQNKIIKKTNISGRNSGSIKEQISLGDWDVEIRAIITADAPVNSTVYRYSQEGKYPRENMQAIYSLISAPISIEVECWFLNQFGIKYLAIESDVDISQVEGEYSMQRVVIPCISDNPLIIKFNK